MIEYFLVQYCVFLSLLLTVLDAVCDSVVLLHVIRGSISCKVTFSEPKCSDDFGVAEELLVL